MGKKQAVEFVTGPDGMLVSGTKVSTVKSDATSNRTYTVRVTWMFDAMPDSVFMRSTLSAMIAQKVIVRQNGVWRTWSAEQLETLERDGETVNVTDAGRNPYASGRSSGTPRIFTLKDCSRYIMSAPDHELPELMKELRARMIEMNQKAAGTFVG